MNLWIFTPKSPHAAPGRVAQFCIDEGVIGFGWPVEGSDGSPDFEEYLHKAKKAYPDDEVMQPVLQLFRYLMAEGDLCWMPIDDVFYLGRITGKWEVRKDGAYATYRIFQVRSCRWKRIGYANEIPMELLRQFPVRRLQVFKNDHYEVVSQMIYNEMETDAQFKYEEIWPWLAEVIPPDRVINERDLIDIACIYLQQPEYGYMVLPESMKRTTIGFSIDLIHREAGARAILLIAESGTERDIVEFVTEKCGSMTVFVAGKKYIDWMFRAPAVEHPQVTTLGTLDEFSISHYDLLPLRIQRVIRAGYNVSHLPQKQ